MDASTRMSDILKGYPTTNIFKSFVSLSLVEGVLNNMHVWTWRKDSRYPDTLLLSSIVQSTNYVH